MTIYSSHRPESRGDSFRGFHFSHSISRRKQAHSDEGIFIPVNTTLSNEANRVRRNHREEHKGTSCSIRRGLSWETLLDRRLGGGETCEREGRRIAKMRGKWRRYREKVDDGMRLRVRGWVLSLTTTATIRRDYREVVLIRQIAASSLSATETSLP